MNHRERIEQLIAKGDYEQANFILIHARYAVRYAGFYPGDKTGLSTYKPGIRFPKFHESVERQRAIEPVRLFWTIDRAGELWEARGHVVTTEGQMINLKPFTAPTEALARMPVLAEALLILHPIEKRYFTLDPKERLTANLEPRERRAQ